MPNRRVIDVQDRLGALAYGGDYNPDQWTEEVWLEDARLMKEAGVNVATLGVFAWSWVEPKEGEYDFTKLDRVFEILSDAGIRICLATPTAAPPAWLSHNYPGTLPVTREGVRLSFGSRAHFCASSPVYREKSTAIARQLAKRYGAHPSLVAWHVNNEYGQDCYCDVSADYFRRWLQDKYGSIDELNRAWGTAFWSQTYSNWSQVEPPRAAPQTLNPSRVLDYQRFNSDALLECFVAERDAIREFSPTVPINTNFMLSFKGLDYWKWAKAEDFVSLDAYPNPAEPGSEVEAAMNFDLMRSLGQGKPWILMEQATSAVNWRPQNAVRKPGSIRLGSVQAIAHGSDGALFFQWRASRKGTERFHSAMLPHNGTDSRIWNEVKEFGSELAKLAEVRGALSRSEVAIVWDWESWWALEGQPRLSDQVWYVEEIRRVYRQLWNLNVTPDFVEAGADLGRYRVVFVPSGFMLTVQESERLREFVNGGGVLVVTFASGLVDRENAVHDGLLVQPLEDALGIRVDEIGPLGEGWTAKVQEEGSERLGTSTLWQDFVEPVDAKVEYRYIDGPAAGHPAVTRNSFGEGEALYIGTALDDETLGALVREVLSGAQVEVFRTPDGVELVSRYKDDTGFDFYINRSDQIQSVRALRSGVELFTDSSVELTVEVPAYNVAVVRSDC